jgi:hypothetical protein
VYFKLLSWDLPGRNENSHGNINKAHNPKPGYESGVPLIRRRCDVTCINTVA